MNKKIVNFTKFLTGKRTKFSVISSKNDIERLIKVGAVKVEEWYVTPSGAIIAVIPDTYIAVDIDK